MVSASSQEELLSPDEDSEQDVTVLPESKVRRTVPDTPEQTPVLQQETDECEVHAQMPSMNRETYRRLPVDKSVMSLITNRRAIHNFFLFDEKWAYDCAKHLEKAKAELSGRAKLIIQRTTSTSMMNDLIFTSTEKFWKIMKDNAHYLRIAWKLVRYAEPTSQLKVEQ